MTRTHGLWALCHPDVTAGGEIHLGARSTRASHEQVSRYHMALFITFHLPEMEVH